MRRGCLIFFFGGGEESVWGFNPLSFDKKGEGGEARMGWEATPYNRQLYINICMRCNACRHVCMSHHFLNLWMFVCPCAGIELFDSATVMKSSRSQNKPWTCQAH